MIDIVTRGMTRTLKAVFLTQDTGEEFDPTDVTVEIRHYSGVSEIFDLPETQMTKVGTGSGHYLSSWTVPNDFPLNEIAFVYYRGTDAQNHRILLEEKLRVAPNSFYPADSVDDMIVKFTKN